MPTIKEHVESLLKSVEDPEEEFYTVVVIGLRRKGDAVAGVSVISQLTDGQQLRLFNTISNKIMEAHARAMTEGSVN